jgi:hypothetical protein
MFLLNYIVAIVTWIYFLENNTYCTVARLLLNTNIKLTETYVKKLLDKFAVQYPV